MVFSRDSPFPLFFSIYFPITHHLFFFFPVLVVLHARTHSKRERERETEIYTPMSSSSLFLSDKPLDKYEKILARYDWRRTRPPRGYQPGVGRGAKLIVTTGELRVGVGVEVGNEKRAGSATHSPGVKEVDLFLDALEAMEDKRQHRHRKSKHQQHRNDTAGEDSENNSFRTNHERRKRDESESDHTSLVSQAIAKGSNVQLDELYIPSLTAALVTGGSSEEEGQAGRGGGPCGVVGEKGSSTSALPKSQKSSTTSGSSARCGSGTLSVEEANAILASRTSSAASVHNPATKLTTRDARQEAVEGAEQYLFDDERGITVNDIVKARQDAAEKTLTDLLGMGSPEEQTTWITHSRAYRESGQRKKALATLREGCRRTGHKGLGIWIEFLSYFPLVMMPAAASHAPSHRPRNHKHNDPLSSASQPGEENPQGVHPGVNKHRDHEREEGIHEGGGEGKNIDRRKRRMIVDVVGSRARRKELEAAVTVYPAAPELWLWLLEVVLPHERLERTQQAILACPTSEELWWHLLSLTPTVEDQKKILLRALQRNSHLSSLWGRLARLEGSVKARSIFQAAGKRYPSLSLAIEAAKFAEWEGLRFCFSAPPSNAIIRTTNTCTGSIAAGTTKVTPFSCFSLLHFFSSSPDDSTVAHHHHHHSNNNSSSLHTPPDSSMVDSFSSVLWPWGSAAGRVVQRTKDEIRLIILSAARLYLQPHVSTSREVWVELAVKVALSSREEERMKKGDRFQHEYSSSFVIGSRRDYALWEAEEEEEEEEEENGDRTFSPCRDDHHPSCCCRCHCRAGDNNAGSLWKWRRERRGEEMYGWTSSFMFAFYVWPEYAQWSAVDQSDTLMKGTTREGNLMHEEEEEVQAEEREKKRMYLPLFHSLRRILFPSSCCFSSSSSSSSHMSWMTDIVSMLPSSIFSFSSSSGQERGDGEVGHPRGSGDGMLFCITGERAIPVGGEEKKKEGEKEKWKSLPIPLLFAFWGTWWILMEEYQHMTTFLAGVEDEKEKGVNANRGSGLAHQTLFPLETSGLSSSYFSSALRLLPQTPQEVVLLAEHIFTRVSPFSLGLRCVSPLLMAWQRSVKRLLLSESVKIKEEEWKKELSSDGAGNFLIKQEEGGEESSSSFIKNHTVDFPSSSFHSRFSTSPGAILSFLGDLFSHNFEMDASGEKIPTFPGYTGRRLEKEVKVKKEEEEGGEENDKTQEQKETTPLFLSFTQIESLFLLLLLHTTEEGMFYRSFSSLLDPNTAAHPIHSIIKGGMNVVKQEMKGEEGRVEESRTHTDASHSPGRFHPTSSSLSSSPLSDTIPSTSLEVRSPPTTRFLFFSPSLIQMMATKWIHDGHYRAAQAILQLGFYTHCVPYPALFISLLSPSSSTPLPSSPTELEENLGGYEAGILYLLSLAKLFSLPDVSSSSCYCSCSSLVSMADEGSHRLSTTTTVMGNTSTSSSSSSKFLQDDRHFALFEEPKEEGERERMERKVESVLSFATSLAVPFSSSCTSLPTTTTAGGARTTAPSSGLPSWASQWRWAAWGVRRVATLPWVKYVIHRRSTLLCWTASHAASSSRSSPPPAERGTALWAERTRSAEEKRVEEEEEEESKKMSELRELMERALHRFPRCEKLWLMRLEAEVKWVERKVNILCASLCFHPAGSRGGGDTGGRSSSPGTSAEKNASLPFHLTTTTARTSHRSPGRMPPTTMEEARMALPLQLAQHQQALRGLYQRAVQAQHCRWSVRVWVFAALRVESELFANAAAARALLVEAGKVCAGGAGSLEQLMAHRRQRSLLASSQRDNNRKKGGRGEGGVGSSSRGTSKILSNSLLSLEECTHILLSCAKAKVELKHSGPTAAREVIEELLQALPKEKGGRDEKQSGGGAGRGALMLPDRCAVAAAAAVIATSPSSSLSTLSLSTVRDQEEEEEIERWMRWMDMAKAASEELGYLLSLYVDTAPLSIRGKACLQALSYWPAPHHPLLLLSVAKVYHQAGISALLQERNMYMQINNNREAGIVNTIPRPSTPTTAATGGKEEEEEIEEEENTLPVRQWSAPIPPSSALSSPLPLSSSPSASTSLSTSTSTTTTASTPPLLVKAMRQVLKALDYSHGRCGDAIGFFWEWCSSTAYKGIVQILLHEMRVYVHQQANAQGRVVMTEGGGDITTSTLESMWSRMAGNNNEIKSSSVAGSSPVEDPSRGGMERRDGQIELEREGGGGNTEGISSPTLDTTFTVEEIRWLVYCVTAYFQEAALLPVFSPGVTAGVAAPLPSVWDAKNEQEARLHPSTPPPPSSSSTSFSEGCALDRSPRHPLDGGHASDMRWSTGTSPLSSFLHPETGHRTRRMRGAPPDYFFNEEYRLPKLPRTGPLWIGVAKVDDPSNVTVSGYREGVDTMMTRVRHRIAEIMR